MSKNETLWTDLLRASQRSISDSINIDHDLRTKQKRNLRPTVDQNKCFFGIVSDEYI